MSDVAACILADSSLDLASQWNHILTSCISPLFTRLHEGRPGESFQIAIVTYATANYQPTPILAKRNFNSPAFVTKELKEDALRLGIGRTGSGPMAALEGYAAALELFDYFLGSHRSSKETPQDKPLADGQAGPLCHIIHISACPTDESPHPLWNQTSNLDTLSWKSLPDELRKRSINLSMVLVNQNKGFAELHSSMNHDAHKPWFKAPDVYTLLLSSPSSWAPVTVKRPKETAETGKAADTKETKRVPASAPKQAQTTATASQGPPPPKTTESERPPSSNQSNLGPIPTFPQIGLAQFQQAVAKIRELEPQLKQAQAQIEMLRQQGRTQDMETFKRMVQPKMQLYLKCKQLIVAAQMKTAAANNSQQGKQDEPKPVSGAGPSGQSQGAGPGSSGNVPPQAPQISPGQAIQQAAQAQRQTQQMNPGTGAAEARPPPNVLPQLSPNIAAQMQKLQAKEGISGLSAMPHHQHHPPSSTPIQQQQQQQQQQSGLSNQQVQPPQPQNPSQNLPPGMDENQIWVGTISWRVTQPMQAQVRVIGKGNIQPHLWPPLIEIEVLRDRVNPLEALRNWMARHRPVLSQMRPVNPENMNRFKNLSSIVQERNVYAIGRPPGENAKAIMIVFPMGGDGSQLAAAVFPETGVPDLPNANLNANINLNPNNATPNLQQLANAMRPPSSAGGLQIPPLNANPQTIAALQNMSQEQRVQLLNHIRQQQLQQAQAAQIQAQAQARAQSQAQLQAQQQAVGAGTNPGGNSANANANQNANPLANLTGLSGGMWPGGALPPGVGQNLQNLQQNLPPGMQGGANLAQALAAFQLQQQRQGGMQGRPGSGGPGPF